MTLSFSPSRRSSKLKYRFHTLLKAAKTATISPEVPMENPAEYVVIGTKLVWALVGGSSGLTLFGVWLLARFTSTFDAYAGERARIEAQFRNVEKLVANTEKLTTATEAIKAKVTDETWDRQQRWIYKQQIYRDLIESVYSVVQAAIATSPYDGKIATQESLENHRILLNRVNTLHTLMAVAAMSASEEANTILRTLSRIESTKGAETITLFGDALAELVIAARKDLGYEPIPVEFP
jgi:hypothetical protein